MYSIHALFAQHGLRSTLFSMDALAYLLDDPTGIVLFSVVIAFTRATALEAMQRQYKRNEKLILGRLRRRMARSSSRRSDTKVAGRSDDTPDLDSWPRRMKGWICCGRVKEEERKEEQQEEEEEVDDEKKDLHEQDFEEAIVELTEENRREFRSEVSSYPGECMIEVVQSLIVCFGRLSFRSASSLLSGSSEQPFTKSWKDGLSL